MIAVYLPQLENRNNHYRRQILSRAWAFLLLGIFVSALMIQGLHYHHGQDQFSTSISKVEKSNSATQIHAAKIGCELCEMIKQQSQYYDLPEQINPVLVLGTSRLLTFSYLPQHPLAYIHAAANKGPPNLQV